MRTSSIHPSIWAALKHVRHEYDGPVGYLQNDFGLYLFNLLKPNLSAWW